MKKVTFIALALISIIAFGQNDKKSINLLNEVSAKVSSYENISLDFTRILVNEEANVHEEINGKINLEGDKYHLSLLGNEWIYDKKNTYVISHGEDKEVNIISGTLGEDESAFIPSKILTFYQTGYTYKWGALKTIKGRKIQFISLIPISSEDENKEISLGIDVKTKNINKVVYKQKNGVVITLKIRSFKANTTLPDNEFVFDKKAYEEKGYYIEKL